ncbi:MAG: alpha/beta hydrolase, partial [Chitinophagaceae bacterium]
MLTVFRAPTNHLWYLAILVTEFSWVFIFLVLLLIVLPATDPTYRTAQFLFGLAAIGFLLVPYLQAMSLAKKLLPDFQENFAGAAFHFPPLQVRPWLFLTGMATRKTVSRKYEYDAVNGLSLDFYPAQKDGLLPCVVVVHGGSWAAGDSLQLPELNLELARAGYHVASINYRLAPGHHYPAPLEDLQQAILFLQQNAGQLNIDKTRFVLLGRSAGGQIALSAAYTMHNPSLRAVIDFYGPTDMVWGYENPTSPLVLDSRKIMEDYLGGTL